ncbi:hypothetical protein Fmac_031295 [Flemingia macrophylla]|uniref:RNase H type-1 domain-containing protein n=1 Tax=Flemingia macrophylla TaxID=520843 RepID=A0ABD1L1P0_9FABA
MFFATILTQERFGNLVCEYDCLEVVEVLQSLSDERIALHAMKDVLQQIRNLTSREWAFSFEHILQEVNKVAESLARLGSHNTIGVYIVPLLCELDAYQRDSLVPGYRAETDFSGKIDDGPPQSQLALGHLVEPRMDLLEHIYLRHLAEQRMDLLELTQLGHPAEPRMNLLEHA